MFLLCREIIRITSVHRTLEVARRVLTLIAFSRSHSSLKKVALKFIVLAMIDIDRN